MERGKYETKPKPEASIKGQLVEMIVMAMYDTPGLNVQRNVRLPTIRDPKRKREIDVLINGSLAGHPIQIAVECKNYKSIIDVSKIDAYIGKLQDVGIPSQLGIYVSAGGYTDGALARSKEVGIIPFTLTGLTPDRLSEEVKKAIQSVVHLLAEVSSLEIHYSREHKDLSSLPYFLCNQYGETKAAVADLIWKQWLEGQLPSVLGEYFLDVEIPTGWGRIINGEFFTVNLVKAKIRVIGYLVEFKGLVTQHELISPTDAKVNRFKANASFKKPTGTYPVTTINNEEDLHNRLVLTSAETNLVTRYRLPRIRYEHLYWPLSKKAAQKYISLVQQCLVENRRATDEELLRIEGSDLKAIWEPIWDENPFLKQYTHTD